MPLLYRVSRDERFEDFALVINRTPQIMALAVDLDEDIIEMPAPLAKTGMRETRCLRILAANSGSKRFHHNRIVSWQMSIPRSNSRSSTLRRDSGNRTDTNTTNRITTGDELKYRKGVRLRFRSTAHAANLPPLAKRVHLL